MPTKPPMVRMLKVGLTPIDTRTTRPAPKRADFDRGSDHKAWRLEVLKRAHWRCQWPGCEVQGGPGGNQLIADHVHERRDGGAALDPSNGQALCRQHHALKTVQERARRMGETL